MTALKNPANGHATPAWDIYAYALVALYLIFGIMQWPLLPRFLDIYYHLGVMMGFSQVGGYVTQAFWEYAPLGRPHLYPPLLHMILLAAHEAGLGVMDVGRLVDCLSFPALLAAYYVVFSRLLARRTAFIALVFFSSVYTVMVTSSILLAFNLAFIFALFAFLFMSRGIWIKASVCLAFCFYTHTYIGWLTVFSLALWAMSSPSRLSGILRTITLALLLALPFLLYQFHYRDYFAIVRVKEMDLWSIDVLLWVFAVAGLIVLYVKKCPENMKVALALFIGFLPLAFTHPQRFIAGHGLAAASVLAAFFLETGIENIHRSSRRKRAAFLVGGAILLFSCLASPVLEWDALSGKHLIRFTDHSMTRSLFYHEGPELQSNNFSIYFSKDYQEIAEVILENSEKDDILWSDFSYLAGVLSLMTDRATSSAMMPEVRSFQTQDVAGNAKILVWLKDIHGKPKAVMEEYIQKRGLQLLKETGMAYILLDPTTSAKRKIPNRLIPTGIIDLVAVAAMAFLLWPMPRKDQLL